RPFAEALDQPGLDEEPQMAGNAGLRLAQDGGEIRDGEFGLPQQREDAQPRGLGGGLERAVKRLKSEVGRRGHGVWAVVPFQVDGNDVGLAYTYLYTLKRRLQGRGGQPCQPPSLPDLRQPSILSAKPFRWTARTTHERQRLRHPRWRNRS